MRKLVQLKSGSNAYTFVFDAHLLDELRTLYVSTLANGLESPDVAFVYEGSKALDIAINAGDYKFQLVSYGRSPLLWVSCADRRTYDVFRRFADSLEIQEDLKELVDVNNEPVMYCGFYVIGKGLDKENWHVDYFAKANAYTLITPLLELDSAHGNLLYRDAQTGTVYKYQYSSGEAIIFGEGFTHSTQPYPRSARMRVLLSFTVGTDKPEYWPVLKRTIGAQSDFFLLPCGHPQGTCGCCP